MIQRFRRTSSDVYNRLMWDSSVSSNDYAIGYEDRFKGTYTPSRYHEDFVEGAHLGVKEMPLGAWKREVEDEAFVSNFGQLPSIIYAENSW